MNNHTQLYLCEKPSQAQDLAQVLGCRQRQQGYWQDAQGRIKITWAIGHLLEQCLPDDYHPEWKAWQLDSLPLIPDTWRAKVRPGVKSQYQCVSQLIKDCQQQQGTLVLATDFDREGEAIGRELLGRCRYRGKVQRLKLTALDTVSIQRALAQPLDEQESLPLYWAAQARQRADWLVGMNFSRLFTLLARQLGLKDTYHVGRVSAPTIALVVERERDIANFVAKQYQELWLELAGPDGNLAAKWQVPESLADEQGHCHDPSWQQQLAQRLHGQTATVSQYQEKQQRQSAPLPLDLTHLQRWADQRLGLSAEQSLKVAQSLYDKKWISYPRTECRYLPTSQFADAAAILAQLRQHHELAALVPKASLAKAPSCFNDSKMQGEAHHGIIPTQAQVSLASLSQPEQQLWLIIAKHYLAQFFPAKVERQQQITFSSQEQLFVAKGKQLLQPGWLEVLPSGKTAEADAPLPVLSKGQCLAINEVRLQDKQTQPPSHFTEANLLSAMENISRYEQRPEYKRILRDTSGLGTPATRHEAIKNALDRGYISKHQRQLRATTRGQCLYELLPAVLRSPGLTASWEQKLKDIEQRQYSGQEFETALTQWLSRLIAHGKSQQATLLSSYRLNPWIQACLAESGQDSSGRQSPSGYRKAYARKPSSKATASKSAGSSTGRAKRSRPN